MRIDGLRVHFMDARCIGRRSKLYTIWSWRTISAFGSMFLVAVWNSHRAWCNWYVPSIWKWRVKVWSWRFTVGFIYLGLGTEGDLSFVRLIRWVGCGRNRVSPCLRIRTQAPYLDAYTFRVAMFSPKVHDELLVNVTHCEEFPNNLRIGQKGLLSSVYWYWIFHW